MAIFSALTYMYCTPNRYFLVSLTFKLGLVQTLNFTCAESNSGIKCM